MGSTSSKGTIFRDYFYVVLGGGGGGGEMMHFEVLLAGRDFFNGGFPSYG